jgi:hypothetical protein
MRTIKAVLKCCGKKAHWSRKKPGTQR